MISREPLTCTRLTPPHPLFVSCTIPIPCPVPTDTPNGTLPAFSYLLFICVVLIIIVFVLLYFMLFLLLSSIFFYFILSLCVLFIINLFCTPVLQTLTEHSSDGCNPLLSTALKAMSTGASILTSLSLTQNKPSFILCLNFDFTFWATEYSWALNSASKV